MIPLQHQTIQEPMIGVVMNPLESMPAVRRRIYVAFWVVGIVLGAVQVGYAAAAAGQPVWLIVALAVYAFLGGAVGYTASRNVAPSGKGAA